MSVLDKLTITIKTSNIDGAGTDADIFLVTSIRNNPVSPGTSLRLPDLPGNENERGESTVYTIDAPRRDMTPEKLCAFTLINGMNGNAPGWHVDRVSIEGADSNGKNWLLVDHELRRWLDTKEVSGPAAPLNLLTPWKPI